MDADHAIWEPKADWSEASPFSATMEGYYGPMPPALIPFFWAPGWNSGQSLHKFQDESGALRGGNPGVRLFAPNGTAMAPDPGTIPAAFTPRPDYWLIVPHSCVFGTEEMSALAPPIAERMSAPTLSLNVRDAATLGLEPGAWVDITLDSGTLRLPVTLAPELPPGVAAMSTGLPATPWAALPAWATLRCAPCP
jgi:NADH-quinone oxidoreductase subunit G